LDFRKDPAELLKNFHALRNDIRDLRHIREVKELWNQDVEDLEAAMASAARFFVHHPIVQRGKGIFTLVNKAGTIIDGDFVHRHG
jgi:hypothetical protein